MSTELAFDDVCCETLWWTFAFSGHPAIFNNLHKMLIDHSLQIDIFSSLKKVFDRRIWQMLDQMCSTGITSCGILVHFILCRIHSTDKLMPFSFHVG